MKKKIERFLGRIAFMLVVLALAGCQRGQEAEKPSGQEPPETEDASGQEPEGEAVPETKPESEAPVPLSVSTFSV
ncbi:hypothetical protein D5278_15350 [bacterium 1XD21-13]|nr:hypothetical protein [bacterium 1XD21-13]